MTPAHNTGRIIGLLVLTHLLTGLVPPYIMLRPLTKPLSFDPNATANAFQVRLSVMLLFVGGAVTVAMAVAAFPVFRRYGEAMAMWVIALAIANFSLQCVENAAWMSMFTLSQDYAKALPADTSVYVPIGAAVRSAWKWVHYTHLLIMVSWMFMLFVALWRSALVPRILAGLGLLTTLMQITGITLPQFIPYPSPAPTAMGLPLGFVYLGLAVWLMVKGFRQRQLLAAEQ